MTDTLYYHFMRPARGVRLSPLDGKDELSEMMVTSDGPLVRSKRRVPLSVEAEEFSLRTGSKIRVPTGEGGDSSRNDMPSREIPEGIVGRSKAVKAVVATTDVAGAVAPVSFADLAGTDVPAVAGSEFPFPAVAEEYSSAVDAKGVPLVIQTGGWRHAVFRVGPVWPGGKTRPDRRSDCLRTVRALGCGVARWKWVLVLDIL